MSYIKKYGAYLLGKHYRTDSKNIYDIYEIFMGLFNSQDAELYYCDPVDIKQLTIKLDDFASERKIDSKNELLIKARNIFDNAITTWQLDQRDYANIREILTDAIEPLNRLDDSTDQTTQAEVPEIEAKEEVSEHNEIKIEIPSPIELKILSFSRKQDMPEGEYVENKLFTNINELHKGYILIVPGCTRTVEVKAVTDDTVVLHWERTDYTLHLGDVVNTPEYRQQNSFMFDNSVKLRFELRTIPPYYYACDIIEQILPIHQQSKSSIIPETAEAEKIALDYLDRAAKEGFVGAWTAKALFAASNDWSQCVIVRESVFKSILLEGINNGALTPNDDEGWQWFEVASNLNDPERFMDDMTRYYDLLATAAENGVAIAFDVMNLIWEPENIIEED